MEQMGKNGKLTAKRVKFIQEYLVDMNATQAAIRSGYSAKRADAIGYDLLRITEVQEALAIARQELSAKTGVTPEKVIEGFARGAFFDLADLYDKNGYLKNVHEIPEKARVALAGIEVEELFEGRGESREHIGRVRKVKLSSRHQNLDSLAKHFGLYDADRSNQVNVKFIVCGTEGQSLEETIKEVGVVELQSE